MANIEYVGQLENLTLLLLCQTLLRFTLTNCDLNTVASKHAFNVLSDDDVELIGSMVSEFQCSHIYTDHSIFSEEITSKFQDMRIEIPAQVLTTAERLDTCYGHIYLAAGLSAMDAILHSTKPRSRDSLLCITSQSNTNAIKDFLVNHTQLLGMAQILFVSLGTTNFVYRIAEPFRDYQELPTRPPYSKPWFLPRYCLLVTTTDQSDSSSFIPFLLPREMRREEELLYYRQQTQKLFSDFVASIHAIMRVTELDEGKLPDYNGRRITISTFNCSIFSMFGPLDQEGHPGWATGVEMQLFLYIVRQLNLTFRVVLPQGPDKWGQRLPNGTWAGGVLKAIDCGTADVGFCTMWNSGDKINFFDMTGPLMRVCLTFLVERPAVLTTKWSSVFKPLHPQVWLLLALATVGVSLVIVFISKMYYQLGVPEDLNRTNSELYRQEGNERTTLNC